MNKKIRKIFLFFLFCIFIVLAAFLVLYSQGYKIDFENKKITQTGGIYLKIKPRQAEIYLDNRFIKETGFIFNDSFFIEELLPKNYTMTVKKQGYFDWEKTLAVKEKEVTEIKNILLFPEITQFETINKNVADAWLSPNEELMILKEQKTPNWELKLYDVKRNVKSQLLAETDISSTSAEIINIEFKEQGKAITITAKISEDTKQFSLLLNKEPFLAEEIKQSLATTTVLSSKEYEDQIYYLDSLGFINRKTNSTIEKINEKPLEPGKIYQIDVFQDYIFLTSEQGELYFLDLKTKQTEKLFDGTKNIKISPDKGKLAFYSDSEIKLFFLKESYDAPKGEKGQNVFLIRLSEKIEDMFWLNYSHLILISKNSVKAMEIDNRDRINMALLSDMSLFNAEEQKTSQAKFFYSFAAGKLFILSGNSLWSSEKLIP